MRVAYEAYSHCPQGWVLILAYSLRLMHNGRKVEEHVLHSTNSFKRERWQLRSLGRKKSYKHSFSITLQMIVFFLPLFQLQWLPFIGRLQVISKPGSPCEREGSVINGGVSSSMASQRRNPGEGLEVLNAYLWNILVPSTINAPKSVHFEGSWLFWVNTRYHGSLIRDPRWMTFKHFPWVGMLQIVSRGPINA